MFLLKAPRADGTANGQVLGETRKQLKEETQLRLVSKTLMPVCELLIFTFISDVGSLKNRVRVLSRSLKSLCVCVGCGEGA